MLKSHYNNGYYTFHYIVISNTVKESHTKYMCSNNKPNSKQFVTIVSLV